MKIVLGWTQCTVEGEVWPSGEGIPADWGFGGATTASQCSQWPDVNEPTSEITNQQTNTTDRNTSLTQVDRLTRQLKNKSVDKAARTVERFFSDKSFTACNTWWLQKIIGFYETGREREGARAHPANKSGKNFFRQLLCKILAFLSKNRIIREFYKFFGNI